MVQGINGAELLSDVVSIDTGNNHSVALRSDGTVWTWGYGTYGKLGNGQLDGQSLIPVQVKGPGGIGVLTDIVAISTGPHHTMALKSDGTVWGWGYNADGGGMLGDGTTVNQSTPVQVKGPGGTGYLTDIVSISAGTSSTFAIKSDGTLWGWGNNDYGYLGDGTTTYRAYPVQVKGVGGNGVMTDIKSVSAGMIHTMAVKTDGTVYSWGLDYKGSIGIGPGATEDSAVIRALPVQVKGIGATGVLTNIASADTYVYHNIAIQTDGSVLSWGYNAAGQIGDNTTTTKYYPTKVKGPGGSGTLSNIVSVNAGLYHSAALDSNGTVWSWGYNSDGQLGNGTTTTSLLPVKFKFRTHYLYNLNNQLLKIYFQKGNYFYRKDFTYDLNGNLISSVTNTLGNN